MRLLRQARKAYGILGKGILKCVRRGQSLCVRTDTKGLSPSDTKKEHLDVLFFL